MRLNESETKQGDSVQITVDGKITIVRIRSSRISRREIGVSVRIDCG